jgi:hypothetical protein
MHLHSRSILLKNIGRKGESIHAVAPLPDHMEETWKVLSLPKYDPLVNPVESGAWGELPILGAMKSGVFKALQPSGKVTGGQSVADKMRARGMLP